MNSGRPFPEAALSLTRSQEGLRLTAYRDTGGVLTIGYGHTGKDVKSGQKITLAQAEALLLSDYKLADEKIITCSPLIYKLTDNQYGALLDFVFNVGAECFWSLWIALNNERYDEVPIHLAQFIYGHENGREIVIQDLVKRRKAEIALWSKLEFPVS